MSLMDALSGCTSPCDPPQLSLSLTPNSDLPQGPGWLPTWQLIVAFTATLNTLSNLTSLTFSRKLYNNAATSGTWLPWGACPMWLSPSLKRLNTFPVNPLQSRTFAIWTLTSAVVRFYAAFNINNKL